MGQLALLGVAPWVNQWLTPLWLVSVGVTVGLVILLALWGLAAVISRLPQVGTLAESPALRRTISLMGTLVLLPIYAWLAWPVVARQWAEGGSNLGLNVLFVALALSPICWLIPQAIIVFVGRRTVLEVPSAVQEGVLLPLFWIGIAFAVFSVVGVLAVRNPSSFVTSLGRLSEVGTRTLNYELAAQERVAGDTDLFAIPLQSIDITFRRSELRKMIFRGTERLEIFTRPLQEDLTGGRKIEVPANEDVPWLVNLPSLSQDFPNEEVDKIFVRNLGERKANLRLTVVTSAPIPEVSTIPITAFGVVAVFLLYLLQRAAMPRLSAVALATFKSEAAQPLFAIMLILGTTLLIGFVFVPYNTFGEDIKMLKTSNMALITVLALIQAIWAASTSISEEIEGRTALTVLSKPIGRRSFIIGKFLGITWTVSLLFVVLGLIFLVTVAYKPIYDVREGASFQLPDGQQLDEATWQLCHWEMVRVVPGLLLTFMQTMVLAAISVAISTRLPMLANFIICFAVYVLGNLAPQIVGSSEEQFVLVRFFGQLIATVFPNLESFNIEAAVAGSKEVPLFYLALAFVYSMIYTVIAMLLALVMFEDRDLA